jgi:malate synthase
MEDAATAEICRAQLWQWLRFEAPFDETRPEQSRGSRRFSLDLFEDWLADELAALGDLPNLKPAARLLHELVTAEEFEEFLTLPAYDLLD